ncbi:fungal-specific transcription factor domain-containing protein [Aspergillus avenaceus]|uniref:Fungal-specific transcription factor domain-containing protein n=1 Tax=Aspergillus avenaceus TaxID=36643 RepID=A0A5N6U124_ASPAV|nr:fungal-specific transcription factor domain-containing protein [Aspergillus avenaceus]
MQSRRSTIRKNGPTRRRKTPTPCEPCRERKVNCDGRKPICGPCTQDTETVNRCVFKNGNARIPSNDEYLQVLYRHIRELEEACLKAGIPVPTIDSDDSDDEEDSPGSSPGPSPGPSPVATTIQPLPPRPPMISNFPMAFPPSMQAESFPSYLTNPQNSARALEGPGLLNANRQPNPFLATSSASCLLRLLAQGPMLPTIPNDAGHLQIGQRPRNSMTISPIMQDTPCGLARAQVDSFLLPPRDLADHLMNCFWERVYCLYPFVDRPAVQEAYESLWVVAPRPSTRSRELNIGLGSKSDSGPRSPVFISAMNMIFALGCQFADIPVTDRGVIAQAFFLRAKKHMGLDMLEIRTLGVVQTLLITVLYLQSVPDPHTCWDLVGMACRIAQGLEIHEPQPNTFKDPLELEIQRRTWHGCVLMDLSRIVSIASGKPSSTSHSTALPLPGAIDLNPSGSNSPFLTAFYTASLELYENFNGILKNAYKPWSSQSASPSGSGTSQQGGLDAIAGLEGKLSEYESKLPSFLNWSRPSNPATEHSRLLAVRRQRNALHARFLYLRVLLYRPAFAQLCSEALPEDNNEGDSKETQKSLHSSMMSKCAIACLKAADDLVSLVFESYQTTTTDAWWCNGFYISAAGLVLIMGHVCRSILPEIDTRAVETTWAKCQQILQYLIPTSHSAKSALLFLQAARNRALSPSPCDSDTDGSGTLHSGGTENPFAGDLENPYVNGANWQGGAMAVDGLGFLCPADLKWFQNWLANMTA